MNYTKSLVSSLFALSLAVPVFAQNNMPTMRKYKEQETGLSYTFSRVNIGGLNQAPAFVSQVNETGSPIDRHIDFRNVNMDEAWELGYTYLQSLEDNAHKVFLGLNYIHADQNTRCPVNTNIGTNQTIYLSQYLKPFLNAAFTTIQGNYPFFAQIKGHFDLVSAQAGVDYRFFRTKNIDFSLFGGSDIAYFSYIEKNNVYLHSGGNYFYTKSTSHANNLNSKNGMSDQVASPAAANDENPHSSIFKTRFYGAGPLFGAKLQVPFNHDNLRLNIKGELSALMGYGSAYMENNYVNFASPASLSITNAWGIRNFQKHNLKLVPAFRGEISLDVIIKNFMFTGGFQQAVYFGAMDINPLIDWSEAWNIYAAGQGNTTRDREGNITTGGPFLKVSVLF